MRPSRRPTTAWRAAQVALARYPKLYARLLQTVGRGSVEKRAFLLLIRSGDIVVDVGANEGYFTLLFSDIVRASGAVYAFEPVAPTFDRLSRRMHDALCFDNVVLMRAACGDTRGVATMLVPDADWGQAALTRHHAGSWVAANTVTSYEAPVLRLDDHLAAFAPQRRVDFVKIDVEGAELDVLRGLTQTLTAHRPLLFCEVYGEWTRSFGHEPAAVLEQICAAGYDRLFALNGTIEQVTRDVAAQIATAVPLNLLCACSDVHVSRLAGLR